MQAPELLTLPPQRSKPAQQIAGGLVLGEDGEVGLQGRGGLGVLPAIHGRADPLRQDDEVVSLNSTSPWQVARIRPWIVTLPSSSSSDHPAHEVEIATGGCFQLRIDGPEPSDVVLERQGLGAGPDHPPLTHLERLGLPLDFHLAALS